MARIRTIKPVHWDDKELPKISLQAHLLWIGTWNFSDDEGVIEADVLLIKSKIFPRRLDVRTEQVSQWLDQLVKARFLVPFIFNNESYYVSRTFGTHQKIDKKQTSKIPLEVINQAIGGNSENVRRLVAPIEESNSSVEDSRGEYRRFAHLKLSILEFEKIEKLGFTKAQIDQILDSIENYKKNTNYKSLFLTAKKWLEKEKSSGKKENYGSNQRSGATVIGDKDYSRPL